jgi:hypothetical protein
MLQHGKQPKTIYGTHNQRTNHWEDAQNTHSKKARHFDPRICNCLKFETLPDWISRINNFNEERRLLVTNRYGTIPYTVLNRIKGDCHVCGCEI